MSTLSAVILAAGAGTRMKSQKSKVVHEVCFRPLIQWVYQTANKAGAEKIVTVVGHKAEQVTSCLGEDKLYALQEQQLGTGHAVMCAMSELTEDGCVLVLSGDVPLITPETLHAAVAYHNENRLSATVITAEVSHPTGYGRIIRDDNSDVKSIVEEKDASPAQKQVTEINSGLYCFDIGLLRAALTELNTDNSQGEYYLTDTLAILLKNGYRVGAYKMEDPHEIMGINDRVQLAQADEIMRRKLVEAHMLKGVTVLDPSTTYIGADVTIGQDTLLYPGCILQGTVTIGQDCRIGPNCHIINSSIGDRTECISSVMTNSLVGCDTHVGPFAYIRPNCKVGNEVKVGDFVELKNTNIDDGTKISHLTYVGDSDVGKGVNFGCGTVTVNYDSKNKHRTTIGNHAFIGCNTNLVAPVTIGDNAYTAAGSTITEDVPENSLAIARQRQSTKEDWRLKKEF